jgi:hypothetical protein
MAQLLLGYHRLLTKTMHSLRAYFQNVLMRAVMLHHHHHRNRIFALLFVCSWFGGCSIHPLPEDVTRYNTSRIVRLVRCETKAAVIEEALHIIHWRNSHPEVNEQTIGQFDLRKLSPVQLIWFDTLERTGIVYSFTLDGSEMESLMFNADFLKVITNGTVTLSPQAGNVLTRQNIRTFTVSDNFGSLMALNDNRCEALGHPGPNYEYPITGRIGVAEMVSTFVQMSVTGNLAAQEESESQLNLSPAGQPAMVDTLKFTTAISGGLTPKVTVSPLGSGWSIMNANLAGTVTRTDTHTAIIGLGLAKPHALVNSSATALFITTAAKGVRTGEPVAAQAVAQQILRFEIGRPIIPVTP